MSRIFKRLVPSRRRTKEGHFPMPRGAVTFLTAFSLVALISTELRGEESAGAMHGQARYALVPDAHGKVLQTPDGRTIFRYLTENPPGSNLAANSACCLYPLNTPAGVRVVDLAPGDHRHHRGVFLAWHSMTFDQTRADFWGWGAHTPTEGRVIRNRSVDLVSADADEAILAIRNDWTIHNKLVLEETLQITVRERESTYVLDMEFTLTPRVDVTLDESAFGGFCVKGRQDGEGAFYSPEGRVDLPAPHHMKPDSDWPPAPWYDYVIRLNEGPTVGVAVISHAENPPTRWHNIAGIAMNNPCIVALGPVHWHAAQSQRLRYRLVVHDGPPPVELLNFMSQNW